MHSPVCVRLSSDMKVIDLPDQTQDAWPDGPMRMYGLHGFPCSERAVVVLAKVEGLPRHETPYIRRTLEGEEEGGELKMAHSRGLGSTTQHFVERSGLHCE